MCALYVNLLTYLCSFNCSFSIASFFDRGTLELSTGGRYDALVDAFRNAVVTPRSSHQNQPMENCKQSAVGGAIDLNEVVTVKEKIKEFQQEDRPITRAVTVAICAISYELIDSSEDHLDNDSIFLDNFKALTHSLSQNQVEFYSVGLESVRKL